MTGLDITMAVLCFVFLGLLFLMFRRQRNHTKVVNYRRLYIQYVAKIETMTVQVNQLGTLVVHLKTEAALDYYEDTLKMLETLLNALNKVPPLSDRGELVRSMEPMVENLSKRIHKCHDKFQRELSGQGLQSMIKDLGKSHLPVTGCYFCSRPFSPKNFKKISIKFQGQKMSVYGCPSCRAELKSKRSVDILHFVQNNRSVHWSELPQYDPTRDYWSLNSRRTKKTRPQLELVSKSPDSE